MPQAARTRKKTRACFKGVRFMAELISYLPLLIIGLFFYGIYESFASSHHIEKLAKEYCEKNNYQFFEVKSAKAHMSIVYKEKGLSLIHI